MQRIPVRENGRPTAACGVTWNPAGMTRDQAIAKAVEAGVPECCASCGR